MAREQARRVLRLRDFDYARPGAYFVTVCTKDRTCLFGDIVAGTMRPSEMGAAVLSCWHDLPRHYPRVKLDAFVVMPNHVHGIVVLSVGEVGAGFKPAPTGVDRGRHGLPEVMRAFKTFSGRRINVLRDAAGAPVWQRGYHDHVIRSEASLARIQAYIIENPLRWDSDAENPANIGDLMPPGRGRR